MDEKYKAIKTGEDARKAIIEGVDIIADAVASTIGPKGRDVIIDGRGEVPPIITNDGVTIASEITFQDRWKNLGAKIIKQAAAKTNDDAGDGTSNCTVLTREIIREGHKLVAAGINPIEIKKGIMDASNMIANAIKEKAIKLDGDDAIERIKQIAMVSGQDEVVGSVLAEVFDKLGEDSIITIEDSPTPGVSVDMIEGVNLPGGWFVPHFCSNQRTMTQEVKKPAILVTSQNLTSENDLIKWIEPALQNGIKDFVIIAPSFSGNALATLFKNHAEGRISVGLVKAPFVGDKQKEFLRDIAFATGSTFIDQEMGKNLLQVELSDLGTAKKVLIEKDRTIFTGVSQEDGLAEYVEQLKDQSKNSKSEYDQERYKERISCMGAGVALINVGASTELEQKELRYKVEDAINAVRGALEGGYLPGGGVTLLRLSSDGAEPDSQNEAYIAGFKAMIKACRKPLQQISDNAGKNSYEIERKILDNEEFSFGWDAAKDEFGNLIDMGIIDPAKVTYSAVLNAASAASTLLISDTAITYEQTEPREQ